jgi:hypothetical protein
MMRRFQLYILVLKYSYEMKMPGFTAESSLYNVSGYHQVGKREIYLHRRQMISVVHPTMQKEERIEVYDCGPGSTGIGEGANLICFPDPLTEPSGPSEPREPREPRQPREPRITGRPARPWPDESPGPRLRPCDASLRNWWYENVTNCFNTMKTDIVRYVACLNYYGCPNLPSPFRDVCRRSAETKCPLETFRTLPLKGSDKAACVASANKFLDNLNCYMPKDLQDEFIGRWAST